MKIQELAIIFIIIILPISLVLSIYTQYQIKTINTQTLYDAKLTSATYDAMRAYQLNTSNSSTSDLANSKLRDLGASVATFRNSIKSTFELNGFSADDMNSYIPALVYTMYDGFYIYSPYTNVNHRENEDGTLKDGNGEKHYGLKPYISYSCRYKNVSNTIDVVITYALDNYVTVQGNVNGKYINDSGYLIDGITINESNDTIQYNGVEIGEEQLTEYLPIMGYESVPYVKLNGTKYYLVENPDDENDEKNAIIYFLNGELIKQWVNSGNDNANYIKYRNLILNNNLAKEYYYDAYHFTKRFNEEYKLNELRYCDAYDEVIVEKDENGDGVNDNGIIEIKQIWPEKEDKIFEFDERGTHIEYESSSFNQHRLEVIRHKIETNLSIAISNYNTYSGADNVFQMPELKENEWDYITHNICLISFLQGLPIGGKIYNGYTLVTNSESGEVVLEPNIYILGVDSNNNLSYHRIGDQGFKNSNPEKSVTIDAGNYTNSSNRAISAGRLNLDFERKYINSNNKNYYYYPVKDYMGSYNSIVMQNEVDTYDDIYEYVNNQGDDLKQAFYTALGRERAGVYKPYKENI